MEKRFPARLACFAFALVLLLLSGCGAGTNSARGGTGGREAAFNERFKLSRDERAWIKDTALAVELKSVRRTWYVDGKSETAEADISLTLDGVVQRQWMDIGEKVTIGDYTVELWAADPFGRTGAQLIVTRR